MMTREELRRRLRETIAVRKNMRLTSGVPVKVKNDADYARLVSDEVAKFDAERAMCDAVGFRHLDGRATAGKI